MMEEDDVGKIAKELEEAALTDVTQASVTETSQPLITSDIVKDSTPPKSVQIEGHSPPVPIETLVSSIPSVSFDSPMVAIPGKTPMVPLQPASSLPGAYPQPSYYTSPSAADSSGSAQPMQPVQSVNSPPQPSNPYRAISGLSTHVSAPAAANAVNIFVPQQPPPMAPSGSTSYAPHQYGPQYPPAFPYDGHSHHGGHGHSHEHCSESFLEIPQDHMTPVWDNQYHHAHDSYRSSDGLLGWFSNVGNKVFEKTKSSVESMITTLDPGMKAVIYSGGDVDVVVTTSNDDVVDGIRQAFQEVFGRATINGMESRSDIAPQPVGFTAGLKGAENKIDNLRRCAAVHDRQTMISIENFIHEVFPDKWFEFGCLVLKDPMRNIDLTVFTQAIPISPGFIQQAQEFTPNDYELRWSGLSVNIGEIISKNLSQVHPQGWQRVLAGVSKRDIIYGAAKVLGTLYKNQCR